MRSISFVCGFDGLQFSSVYCVADLGLGESTAPDTKYEYVLCIVLMCCSLVLMCCSLVLYVVLQTSGRVRAQRHTRNMSMFYVLF